MALTAAVASFICVALCEGDEPHTRSDRTDCIMWALKSSFYPKRRRDRSCWLQQPRPL
jgi:hypothetical protein